VKISRSKTAALKLKDVRRDSERSHKESAMTDRFLTRRQVAELFGVSTRTIDSWHKAGRLPPAARIPSDRPRWRESTLRLAIRQPTAELPA
jgi:predicted DNA-binding transcriptional regulator AlpA